MPCRWDGCKEKDALLTVFLLVLFLLFSDLSSAANIFADSSQEDLTTLSLEDLMNLSITSASKRPQRLSDAAAAIFVITQEDIRRSGATSIPEILRMVPGIEVARIDANKWAITSRGFNGRFSNKLLVLFDGRTIYNPLFSGVFWNNYNYILEDIDRIEVIRGPGASLWGANAVNGVINIITKKAKDTQGGLVVGTYGDHEAIGSARYGDKIDKDTFYRVYSKYYDHGGFPGARGIQRDDSWNYFISGARIDRDFSPNDSMTLQGDFLNNNGHETYLMPSITSPFLERLDSGSGTTSGNALARWNHIFSSTSNLQLQAYYDRNNLRDPLQSEQLNTFDFEMQHQFRLGSRQTIIWGLEYRFQQDETQGSSTISLAPEHTNNLFSAFVQDEIQLVEDKLALTLGSRFEHNDITGFEMQPNARLLWTPEKKHSLWTALSRAVRTPSWAELDLRDNLAVLPPSALNPLPTVQRVGGNPNFKSEELNAFEIGYRFRPSESLFFDLAAFYNIYSHLRSVEAGRPFIEFLPAPHVVLPIAPSNKLEGDTYGLEIAADYQMLKGWRLQAAYTFLRMDLRAEDDSLDVTSAGLISGSSPHHQFSVRSWMDFPHHVQFDLGLKFVDGLPALNVDSYVSVDARLAWKPLQKLEFAIVAQNLVDNKHVEMVPDILNTIEAQIERSVYGKIVWRF